MIVNLGDVFLIDTPPNDMHFYIVIAHFTQTKYLLVNITTRREKSESTCIINPGPGIPSFIKRESIVTYKYARVFDSENIIRLISQGRCYQKGSISDELLERIQRGGLISKRLSRRYKQELRDFLKR